MSLPNELGLSEDEWQNADEPTRNALLKGYARFKELALLMTQMMFQDDHNDARRRGRRREDELFGGEAPEMKSAMDEMIILGDNNNIGTQEETAPSAAVPTPQPSKLKSGLLAAALAAGSAGAGGLGAYALLKPDKADDTDTRFVPVIELVE